MGFKRLKYILLFSLLISSLKVYPIKLLDINPVKIKNLFIFKYEKKITENKNNERKTNTPDKPGKNGKKPGTNRNADNNNKRKPGTKRNADNNPAGNRENVSKKNKSNVVKKNRNRENKNEQSKNKLPDDKNKINKNNKPLKKQGLKKPGRSDGENEVKKTDVENGDKNRVNKNKEKKTKRKKYFSVINSTPFDESYYLNTNVIEDFDEIGYRKKRFYDEISVIFGIPVFRINAKTEKTGVFDTGLVLGLSFQPRAFQRKTVWAYTYALWSFAFGVMFRYDQETKVSNFGIMLIPYQFRFESVAIGVGVAFISNSSGEFKINKENLHVVIPISICF